ncbi:hypothetical protein FRC01_002629, partial [Tulasnella sp. 417]
MQAHVLDPTTGSPHHGTTTDDSTPSIAPLQQSELKIRKDDKERGPISDATLAIARKTFKSVEIASGAIPVAGSYVGAAAKTMDRNQSLAVDLGDHTSKLTKLLENFQHRSRADEQNVVGQIIKDLHGELDRIKEKVDEWSLVGQFKKAFSARDHAEALKEYQGVLQTTREEIQ